MAKRKINYDVIVIGGGHAGCEAAHASARTGASTCLITHSIKTIGLMSCNPAFGGVGKGHLIREIDALDGLMGVVSDFAAIQYRELNRSRGPAVRGPRVQADREIYKDKMQNILLNTNNLEVIEGSVINLIIKNNRANGITLDNGNEIFSTAVVLTTGTFLSGVIHIGNKKIVGGRVGEKSETELSKQIKNFDFKIGRLKTGTPPRLLSKSINYNNLEKQEGDISPKFMSFLTTKTQNPQISCYLTRTNINTHHIISNNIHNSAIYNGNITSSGPRYCPSIEDKVNRFAHKDNHQVFLEPEGLNSNIIYPNGISTSLPQDVQEKFIRTIPGLEDCKITQPGYAIEYDFIDPTQLKSTLETKKIKSLFFAGQINGTTGYEEAGAQGLVAGVNAAFKSYTNKSFIIDRSQAYMGVLIDDLIMAGVSEPYRMFTSRSEYRLLLRTDNADERLTDIGIRNSIISKNRISLWKNKKQIIKDLFDFSNNNTITPTQFNKYGFSIKLNGKHKSICDLLSLPNINVDQLYNIWPKLGEFPQYAIEQLEISAIYSGYLDRQLNDIERFRKDESLLIPEDISYAMIGGISNEMIEKLELNKPRTLGAASRIKGITPGCLTALFSHVKNSNQISKF